MRKNIFASEGAATYLFAICGASLIGYAFTLIMSGRGGSFAGVSVAGWTNYALTQLAFIGVIAVFSAVRKFDPLAVAKIKPSKNWKQYALLPFIAFAAILAFYPLALLFMRLLSLCGYPVLAVYSIDFSNVGVYFLALVLMAVLPAVGEEFLCRGIVQSGLNTRGIKFGILISALLFSLLHASPTQTVHQFGLGIVLAIVFILSGSLLPCVLLHFLNNFMTLTVSAYIPQVDQIIFDLGYWNYLTGAASVIVGLFMLVLLLYVYYRVGKPLRTGKGGVNREIVFDDVTFTVSYDGQSGKKENAFIEFFRFFGSLFTARGWRAVGNALENKLDTPVIGKAQPMTNVWLSIGFAAIYWVFAFITGIV